MNKRPSSTARLFRASASPKATERSRKRSHTLSATLSSTTPIPHPRNIILVLCHSIASDLVWIPHLGVVATFSSHQAAGPPPSGVNPTSPLLTLTDSHPSHPLIAKPHPGTALNYSLTIRGFSPCSFTPKTYANQFSLLTAARLPAIHTAPSRTATRSERKRHLSHHQTTSRTTKPQHRSIPLKVLLTTSTRNGPAGLQPIRPRRRR